MKKTYAMTVTVVLAAALCGAFSIPAAAHCQIPCGIYDDAMRFEMMNENIKTIEKSMNQIMELSKAADKNYNQIVRWVINKDQHADELSESVSYYFMAQRVKPADPKDEKAWNDYVKKITLLHEIMITAMNCKQEVDLKHVEKLKTLVADFKTAYMGPKAEEMKSTEKK